MSKVRKPSTPRTTAHSVTPAPAAARPDWHPHAWRILAVCALALLAWSNSFQGALIFDNATAILLDTRVRAATAENLHLIVNEEYWYNNMTTGLYRPLTTLTYLFNYAVLGNGAHPAGYHIVNFLLHAVNIAVVYWLGLLVLEDTTLAWALAGLWGVHPILTESVSNVVGRADLLAAFGVLAGLICHISATRAGGRANIAWLAVLAAVAAVGVFAKESGVVLPGIMLLYDLTWRRTTAWRRLAPGYVAVALPIAWFLYLRAALQAHIPLGRTPFGDNPLLGAGFWTARITAVQVIGKYLWLFLWPVHLSVDYSYNAVPLFAGWQDLAAIAALCVCAAAAVLAIRAFGTHKPVFFFIAFFFITLAPVSNLVILIGSIMAERFVYLPSVAIAACIVIVLRAACRHLSSRWPAAVRAERAVVIAICLAFAARTFARNFDWHDDLSLWTSTVATVPASFKAHTTLASALVSAGPGELDHAVSEADRALAILDSVPDDYSTPRPYATAGLCDRLKGDSLPPAQGAAWYRKALAVLERGRRVDLAEREQIRLLNLANGHRAGAPGWMPLYLELGRVYLRLSDPQKALEPLSYGRLHSVDPDFSIEMARAWRARGDWQQAAIVLLEGAILYSSTPKLATELVDIYKQAAPTGCAVRESAGASSINVDCPMVHEHVCAASLDVAETYRRNGQAAKADTALRSAVRDLGCPGQ